ncbi:hypothetical protein ACFLIM_10925 [Nonomuraea sp. M3C6]|uniref:Uncharacterized protein n=1 Tax=Nonomuraea marmarensis TaxID=3351344 RepID=A0ABW7A8N0_9ACTN
MNLRFLGTTSGGGQSPTLYSTDRDSYVVQGWIVTDPEILATLSMTDEETCVEVPARLFKYLEQDGVKGRLAGQAPPIVHATENGNYIVQGTRVHDAEALSQMRIPDHETCLEITKAHVLALVEGN